MATNNTAASKAASSQQFWQGCLTINASWPYCGGLAGYTLDTRLGNNASSLPGLFFQGPMVSVSAATDADAQVAAATATFWRNFAAYFNENLATMPTSMQNSTYVASFRSMYECPGYNGYHRRYLYSIWCILLVMSSYPACGNDASRQTASPARGPAMPAPVPLCRKTCKDYADTTIQTLRNTTQCPPSSTFATSAIDAVAALCDSAVFNGDASNCISGDEIEPGNCGYLPQSRGNMSAACTPFIGRRASASARVAESSKGASAALKTTLTVLGLLGASLLFVFGVVLCLRWRRNQQQRSRLEEKEWGNRIAAGGVDGTFRAGKSSEPWDNGAAAPGVGGTRIAGTRMSSIAGSSSMLRRSNQILDAMQRRVSGGAICTVVRDYAPTLADELEIMVGDRVRVEEVYDDGWAAGSSLATGAAGVFPLTHVARVSEAGGAGVGAGAGAGGSEAGHVQHETVDVNGARKMARSTYVRDSDVR